MSNIVGSQQVEDGSHPYNATSFVAQMLIGKAAHVFLAQVTAVTNTGAVAPTGTVDVMPLLPQLDTSGNQVPISSIYGLLYFRIRATAGWAIIADPAIGDIGIVVVADRDISSAKANRGPANPGSDNQFNESDGIFIGGTLDKVPTQSLALSATGLAIVTPQNITISAANVTLDEGGNLTTKGNMTWNTGTAATDAAGHKHGGVTIGDAQTDVPVAGT